MDRNALVILGMHRSGTSALARVLSLRGAALPRHLMPANAGNTTGFWEPERLVALNDRILASFGVAWNDAFAPGRIPAPDAFPSAFLDEARQILREEYGDNRLIVIKDPRCTLLQAFWREALESLGVRMLPVVSIRAPGEVVASLVRRDGSSAEGAALLYASYGIAAARTPGPVAYVDYHAFLQDWRGQSDRIASELGFAWPRLRNPAAAEIEEFLRPGKPASKHALPAIGGELCQRTWACLEGAAAGKPCTAGELDRLEADLGQLLQPLVPLLLDKNRELDGQRTRLGEGEARERHVHGLFEQAQRDLGEAAGARDVAIAERDKSLALYRETDERLAAAQALLTRTADERDVALGERDQALALIQATEDRLAQAEARVAATARERDVALSERDKALALIQESEGRLAQGQAQLAGTARERDAALSERDKALALIQETEGRLAQAQAQLAGTARERDAALSERDRALALIQDTEARLAQVQVQLAGTARERDAALSERDKALGLIQETESRLARVQAQLAGTARERDMALAERDKALALIQESEARLAQAQAHLAGTARERDTALAERDNALALIQETEARLAQSQAHLAGTARERDTALSERDVALSERDKALQRIQDTEARIEVEHQAREELSRDLASARARIDEAAATHASLLALYQSTDALLQKAQGDYAAMEQRALRLDAEYRRMASFAREIVGSRSWRVTARLRQLARRLRGLPGSDPALPVFGTAALPPRQPSTADANPAAAATPDAPDMIAAPIPQSLNDFLFDEFGPMAAADVVERIARYRLPVDTREVRSASALACSEAQALEWACALAARPCPDAGEAPDVSIIVPVYNQVSFTLAAIDSLLSHNSRFSFEILVGDDGSSDATAVALAEPIPNLRHIRHPENLGFVRNCNTTATHARGRYVLFLNNDTQVLPGWLDELVGTLESDPQVGLAGSKLIYPDGRLQECGAIVWRDGSAWNFGRLQDPRRPEYCYRRDVDYVSGASIALRRELWEQLGGFDEVFVPAYAEDADLAFRIREQHGLRTVVQPLSQLLHFEGISSGTDLASGAKAYQVRNLRTLYERWKDVLAGHRDNADAPELEKERGVQGRVLFVDHCTPTPNEDAGSAVAFETMRGFIANGYKVTFIPEDNFAHMGAGTHDLQRLGIEAIYHPAYSRMGDFLAERGDPFDVLFLHRFGVGDAHLAELRRRYPSSRVLFLNADMHHLRELREAELSGDEAALAHAQETRERELAVIGAADVTLVHSDFEQALLARELPDANVALYPLIHEPAGQVAPLPSRSGVVFVGGFRHPPNADGITWFVEAVWPLVRAERPDAELFIVGSHVTPEVEALAGVPGVTVEGFIEDLDGYLARRRASIAPLRYGAGAKGKVAGSLAQGVPVACTTIAAEGMGLQPGEEVLVADAPEDLAGCVLKLLRDDAAWQRLSVNGLAYATRTTSRASAHARLQRLLER